MEEELEEFEIITDVRKGYVLSPLIFLLVMDWLMKCAIEDCSSGSRHSDLWSLFRTAQLQCGWYKGANKRVADEAATLGLQINAEKIKFMQVGKWDSLRWTAN